MIILPSFIKSNKTTGKIGVLYLSKIVLNSEFNLSFPLWKKDVWNIKTVSKKYLLIEETYNIN